MSIHAYKDSEVGKIPFEWSVKQIGKIGYTYSGLTGKEKNDFGKGNARYITFLNVLNNPVLRTNIFERVSVSDGEHQNLALKGDLFFNTSSETPEEVGICALLDDDVPNLYLNSFCFGYRLTDPEVDGLFLSYFFRSKAGRDIMTMLAQGATRYNLSKESFNKTLIAFPPFEEQKKIAEALSGIDDMLGALDVAIAKKRQIKEGLMQQLLTGKTRLPGFCGEWLPKNLGKSALIKARIGWQGLTTKEYLDSGVYYLITGTDFKDGRIDWKNCHYVTRDRFEQDPYIKIQKHDVLVSKDGTIGKVAYLDDIPGPGTLNSGVFVIRSKDKQISQRYLAKVFVSKYFDDFIDSIVAGSTIVHLYQKDIVKFDFMVPPSIEEQEQVCDFLEGVDNEIICLESKRDKYASLKQGMMQELLTGKTRL